MQHKIYSILFSLLGAVLLFATRTSAQSPLIGNWEGEITVESEGQVLSSFKMVLLISSDSLEVQGQSWVWYNDQKAIFGFRGHFDRGVLQIKDVSLLEFDKLSSGEWCYKDMILQLSHTRKYDKLQGVWSGNTTFSKCQPGKIVLKKVMKRA